MIKPHDDITDDDLTLLYYGEHEDPALPAQVAASNELGARFDALSAELTLADHYQPPERGDDYGAEVWQKISPRLSARQEAQKHSLSSGIRHAFAQPRFSLAGAFSLVMVATLAFMLGRNGAEPQAPANPESGIAAVVSLAGIDSSALLDHSVSGHLEQVNMVLTRFVNDSGASAGTEAEHATDLLLANRLYRHAAAGSGDQKMVTFLADLEPLLIELAYEAHAASPLTHSRMQQEVRDGLLFRVRVMNNQLKKPRKQPGITI